MEVLDWLLDHWGLCMFVIAMFVQFTPAIKFNPLEWLGNLINGKVLKKVDELEKKVDANERKRVEDNAEIEKAMDTNEKDRIRFEVLAFADSCRNHVKHSKEQFEHILALNDKYQKLLEKTNDSNGVFESDFEFIKEIYGECLRENKFI